MHEDFDLPGRSRITGRKSTLTGLFFVSITPIIEPTDDEVRNALRILGMAEGQCVCAYCGDPRTEWDHFRPIVQNRKPTGYITEIANLVPSCSKCNQSKGNKYWKDWILSDAPRSPKSRNAPNLEEKIRRLESYEKLCTAKRINYEEIVGHELWHSHMGYLDQVLGVLSEAEQHAEQLRDTLENEVRKRRQQAP